MILDMTVLAETSQVKDGVEYVQLSALESGATPLLQVCDYSLAPDETGHKGKLVGKVIRIQVNTIRSLFSGRPQMSGKILSVNGSK